MIALGLYLLGTGVRAATSGEWVYTNYLRWPVAALAPLAIGSILIVAGLAMHR